jgi:hypothetical protein
MKVIRVPWIQCRADEIGAESFPCVWRGRDFEIMAFSAAEAREWWESLSEGAKGDLLGLRTGNESDGVLMLF